MIASDGIIENGKGHPRGAGTFARVLGRYVREEHALTLMDAVRKASLMPARRLEDRCRRRCARKASRRRRRCRHLGVRSRAGDRQGDIRECRAGFRGLSPRPRRRHVRRARRETSGRRGAGPGDPRAMNQAQHPQRSFRIYSYGVSGFRPDNRERRMPERKKLVGQIYTPADLVAKVTGPTRNSSARTTRRRTSSPR